MFGTHVSGHANEYVSTKHGGWTVTKKTREKNQKGIVKYILCIIFFTALPWRSKCICLFNHLISLLFDFVL